MTSRIIYFPTNVFNIILEYCPKNDFPITDPLPIQSKENLNKTLQLLVNTTKQIRQSRGSNYLEEEYLITPNMIKFYSSPTKSLYLFLGYISNQ